MTKPTDDRDMVRCSFCGKYQDQVRKIIAGPGVFICNECIELCSEIVEEDYTVEDDEDEDWELPTPQEIKNSLDDYVIGQDKAGGNLGADSQCAFRCG